MNNTRNRYQHGSLTIERRKSGLAVWVYRWREEDSQGRFTRRKRIIGGEMDFPTKAAGKRAMDGLRLEINSEANSISSMTVHELIEHYRQTELSDENSKTIARSRSIPNS